MSCFGPSRLPLGFAVYKIVPGTSCLLVCEFEGDDGVEKMVVFDAAPDFRRSSGLQQLGSGTSSRGTKSRSSSLAL